MVTKGTNQSVIDIIQSGYREKNGFARDRVKSYGTQHASSFVTIASAESVVVENGIVSTGSLSCDLSDSAQLLFVIHITERT